MWIAKTIDVKSNAKVKGKCKASMNVKANPDAEANARKTQHSSLKHMAFQISWDVHQNYHKPQ